MTESTLDEIKQAENDADRIVEDARKKSAAIVAGAKEKAAEILRQGSEEAARVSGQLAGKRQEKLQAVREKVLGEGAAEIKSLRKSGEKRVEEAVGLVLEAFEMEISQV